MQRLVVYTDRKLVAYPKFLTLAHAVINKKEMDDTKKYGVHRIDQAFVVIGVNNLNRGAMG